MKLAEALSVRKDLQNKIDQLEDRLKSIVKIQEGDEPDEAAEDLLSELKNASVQLEDVIYRVNRTNLHAVIDGVPITKLIARKDVLTREVGILRNVLKVASAQESRYSRNEIKYVRTIDTAELRKKVDRLSAELRRVDLRIQEANWMFELEPCD
ncbi:MAG TPA: DIP1984 family protein [Candidatus Coprenecus pullicola]|nr:DIP1984 family protein [Candidatus Coprenecus pullicola]